MRVRFGTGTTIPLLVTFGTGYLEKKEGGFYVLRLYAKV